MTIINDNIFSDSVIFSHDKSKDSPIKLGHFLGDMEPEYDGQEIVEFVGAGPKQYALEVQDNKGGVKHTLKIRGITLNEENAQKLNYNIFKEMILSVRQDNFPAPALTENTRILPVRQKGIVSRHVVKKYLPVFNKGFLAGPNCNIVHPFGFCKD